VRHRALVSPDYRLIAKTSSTRPDDAICRAFRVLSAPARSASSVSPTFPITVPSVALSSSSSVPCSAWVLADAVNRRPLRRARTRARPRTQGRSTRLESLTVVVMAAKRSVSPGPIDLMKVSWSCAMTFSGTVPGVAFSVSFSGWARATRPSTTRTGDEQCCVAQTGRGPRLFFASWGLFQVCCVSNNSRRQFVRSISRLFFSWTICKNARECASYDFDPSNNYNMSVLKLVY